MPLSSAVIVVAVFFITILLQHIHVASSELYSDNSSVYNVITNEDISRSYFSPSTSRLRRSPIFQNEFAVYIPSGTDVADSLADKYGFSNLGQIGSLKRYYLFHHRHISKRSVSISEIHHDALNSEPQVRWVQQQHEKVRKKRDYAAELNYPRLTSFGGLLRNVAPPQSRVQYRDTGVHYIFPDPLFKEQWYLNGGAKDGLDMNVAPAWQKGYTGKGIVVSILDDGIQTNHPDLAQNYDMGASYDINGNDSDPMPQDNGDNKHGTRCAGEVAAVAFNNYCGVGVAYNASIGVYASYPDVSAQDFLFVQTDTAYRKVWDKSAITLEIVDQDPANTLKSQIIYWEMLWPKLFATRDYVFNRRYFVDNSRKVIVIANKSIIHPCCPVKPSSQRVCEYWSYMVIKPFTNNFKKPGLEYVLTYFDNPGVVLPPAITSWVAQKQMPDFLNKLYCATLQYAKQKKEEDVVYNYWDGIMDPGFEYPPGPIINFHYSDCDDKGDDGSNGSNHDKSETEIQQEELLIVDEAEMAPKKSSWWSYLLPHHYFA